MPPCGICYYRYRSPGCCMCQLAVCCLPPLSASSGCFSCSRCSCRWGWSGGMMVWMPAALAAAPLSRSHRESGCSCCLQGRNSGSGLRSQQTLAQQLPAALLCWLPATARSRCRGARCVAGSRCTAAAGEEGAQVIMLITAAAVAAAAAAAAMRTAEGHHTHMLARALQKTSAASAVVGMARRAAVEKRTAPWVEQVTKKAKKMDSRQRWAASGLHLRLACWTMRGASVFPAQHHTLHVFLCSTYSNGAALLHSNSNSSRADPDTHHLARGPTSKPAHALILPCSRIMYIHHPPPSPPYPNDPPPEVFP